MGRINLDVTEFAFNPKNTPQYALTILIGFDSLYYCIADDATNVLVIRSFHLDHNKNIGVEKVFDSVLAEDALMKKEFRTTTILIDTVHSTCVPYKFFDAQMKHQYFKNITNISTHETVFLSEKIDKTDAIIVYPVDKSVYEKLLSTFKSATITNAVTAFSEYILSQKNNFNSDRNIFINFRDSYIQIFFFDSGQLIFNNTYKFAAPQDVVYFILLIYEQFKLNPSTQAAYVSGSITEDSDIFKFIFRYIRNVLFLPKPVDFHLGNQFTGIPTFFYIDLFAGALYSKRQQQTV